MTKNNSLYQHAFASITLAIPLILAQLTFMLIALSDTVMVGWLGTTELAALTLASTSIFLIQMIFFGFPASIVTIVAESEGSEDITVAKKSVRMCIWILSIATIPLMFILWNIKPIMLFLSQDLILIEIMEKYIHIAQWILLPSLWAFTLESFLSAINRAKIVFLSSIIGLITNIALNYLLIFGNLGAPKLGVSGAAIASLCTNFVIFFILIFYCLLENKSKKYQIFDDFTIFELKVLKKLIKLGTPISVTMLSEIMVFSMAAIMMGWIGTIELAAHGVAIQIAFMCYTIPLGLSEAGTIRIAYMLGRKDHEGLKNASKVIYFIGTFIGVITGILLFFFSKFWMNIFLDVQNTGTFQVIKYGTVLLSIVAVMQPVECLNVISIALSRGLSDTKIPMLISIISYWFLGIGCAYYLSVHTPLKGVGIWIGLGLGVSLSAFLNLIRYQNRLSRAIKK